MEFTVSIERPVQEVFSYLANMENASKWETPFLEVKRVPGTPQGVGCAFEYRRRVPGRVVGSTLKFTEYLPNKRIVVEGDWVGAIKPGGTLELEDLGNRTRLVMTLHPEFRGLFGPVGALLFSRDAKKYDGYLANLKGNLEARG